MNKNMRPLVRHLRASRTEVRRLRAEVMTASEEIDFWKAETIDLRNALGDVIEGKRKLEREALIFGSAGHVRGTCGSLGNAAVEFSRAYDKAVTARRTSKKRKAKR